MYINLFVERQKRKINGGCEIILFNPPYSWNVGTDTGKKFFLLLDKNFPKTLKLYNIFNRKNVKVRYNSMPNVCSLIKSQNQKISSNDESNSSKSSKDRDKTSCPLTTTVYDRM